MKLLTQRIRVENQPLNQRLPKAIDALRPAVWRAHLNPSLDVLAFGIAALHLCLLIWVEPEITNDLKTTQAALTMLTHMPPIPLGFWEGKTHEWRPYQPMIDKLDKRLFDTQAANYTWCISLLLALCLLGLATHAFITKNPIDGYRLSERTGFNTTMLSLALANRLEINGVTTNTCVNFLLNEFKLAKKSLGKIERSRYALVSCGLFRDAGKERQRALLKKILKYAGLGVGRAFQNCSNNEHGGKNNLTP